MRTALFTDAAGITRATDLLRSRIAGNDDHLTIMEAALEEPDGNLAVWHMFAALVGIAADLATSLADGTRVFADTDTTLTAIAQQLITEATP